MDHKPTRAELEAARSLLLRDVIGPGLAVLFCGINPGLYSGAVGHHFARPGNRFWPALHAAGFTPRQLDPSDDTRLLEYGCGVTNLAPRTTASAAELADEELLAGGKNLRRKLARYQPRWLAVLGIGAYRTAFGRPKAAFGEQPERLGDTAIWVLPNPSGINASYQPRDLRRAFVSLRKAAGLPDLGAVSRQRP